jgi:beta-glucuronidase
MKRTTWLIMLGIFLWCSRAVPARGQEPPPSSHSEQLAVLASAPSSQPAQATPLPSPASFRAERRPAQPRNLSSIDPRTQGPPTPSDVIAHLAGRTTTSLNGTWHIIVDPQEKGLGSRYYENRKPKDKSDFVEYDFDHAWTASVPGDWNSQRDTLLFYEGPVWYQRSFSYDKRAKTRVFLQFGGANYKARVYLNGKKLGEHEGGFTPFGFEVTDAVAAGENFVVVEVDNSRHREAVPGPATDWWNYGGLTRDVTLLEVPETFVQNFEAQLAKGAPDQVAGWVQLNGATKPQEVTLEIPEAQIKQTITPDASGKGEFRFPAKLQLWSPETPKLYHVIVSAGGDSVSDEVGFRTVEARGTQILLNGKPIFLRGICMHEEAPMRSGRAFSEDDDRILLGWAQELGVNFVRMAHYPYNENMSRVADRMGILLWAEIPLWQGIDWENPATLQNAETQMREMIERDHNRASIIFWSLSNETRPGTPRNEFLKNLGVYTRQLDSTRLITSAMNSAEKTGPKSRALNDPLGQFLDVLGINEYIGWYEGTPEDAADTRWTTAYNKPIIFSEFGGGAQFGRHADSATRWSEEYQANIFRQHIRMLQSVPGLAGLTPWVLMDFRSPGRPLSGIQDFYNRKGLLTVRGEKKQAYYVLQDYYRDLAAKK